jgi:hypothetical protein
MIIGGLMLLVGWVWILITAFAESVPWAVGIFFIGILAPVYGYLRWEECKVPTVVYLIGGVLFLIGRYG